MQDKIFVDTNILILSSALENNCSIFYTEDMQDGQIVEGKIRIINPFKQLF